MEQVVRASIRACIEELLDKLSDEYKIDLHYIPSYMMMKKRKIKKIETTPVYKRRVVEQLPVYHCTEYNKTHVLYKGLVIHKVKGIVVGRVDDSGGVVQLSPEDMEECASLSLIV